MSEQKLQYNNSCQDELALCKITNKEKFWLDDVTELYKEGKFTKFIPRYEMTRNQQLNALTRFCIYMIILILAFNRGESILIIPITMLIGIVLFKKFQKVDDMSQEKELDKIIKIRKDKDDNEELLKSIEYAHDDDPKLKTFEEMSDEAEKEKGYIIKSGVYDSDGNLVLGDKEKPSDYLRKDEKNYYTVDEIIDYEKNTCRKPTRDNPLMNPAATEFGNFGVPSACNSNDDNIKESIKVNFDHQLFRDVDELWERENSQRQFYTMPNTAIPNNQKEFANWLYKLPNSAVCKVQQQGCLRYDDVRQRLR
jgi:hypothetical protein